MKAILIEDSNTNAKTFKTQDEIKTILHNYGLDDITIEVDKNGYIDIVPEEEDYLRNWNVRGLILTLKEIIDEGEYYLHFKNIDVSEYDLFDVSSYKVWKNGASIILYGAVKETMLKNI